MFLSYYKRLKRLKLSESEQNISAAAVVVVVKAVVEVVSINKESRRVAIQGSRGSIMIVPVMDDAVLNNLKIAEVVIIDLVNALLISFF
jgi:hypothetical protein